MKTRWMHLLLIVLLGASTGGCEINIFDEDYNYPAIRVSTDFIDFGYVHIGQRVYDEVIIDNVGSYRSRLYFTYYLTGDEDFYLLIPERDVVLEGRDVPYRIPVEFSPLYPGDAQGNLIILYSDRPLWEEHFIREMRVGLIGTGLPR